MHCLMTSINWNGINRHDLIEMTFLAKCLEITCVVNFAMYK